MIFLRRYCLSALAAIASIASCKAVLIDDFEWPGSPSEWIFSNGPEYPGATGSLTAIPGYSGTGARLSVDLTGGGNYVSAGYPLPRPRPGAFVAFWARNGGNVRAGLRVQDSSGQVFSYFPNRPFEAGDPSQWYHLVINLANPDAFFGGANDGVIHNPLTSISLVAQPASAPVCHVDFDTVEMFNKLPITLDHTAKAIPTGVKDFPGSAGVEIEHLEDNPSALALVQSLGFHWIRTEMFWGDIETVEGVYDFSWYDGLVSDLAAHGLQPEFILCDGNPLYTDGNWFEPPVSTPGADAFRAFCAAAAVHFAQSGAKFEVWNEPDNPAFWPDPNADAYAALCASVVAAIHQAAPAAQVTTGGLEGDDFTFLDNVLLAGGAVGADGVGLHPYRTAVPEQFSNDLVNVHTLIAVDGPGSPSAVWTTEAGYSSTWLGATDSPAARRLQAKYGVRQILTAAGLGIPFQVTFALHDHGTDLTNPVDNFGIVDNNYQPKPLTAAVSTLFSQCGDRTLDGNVPSGLTGLHVLRFHDASSVLLVAWLDTPGNASEEVALDSLPVSAVDFKGRPAPVTQDGGGQWTVIIGNSPVYLVFPHG